MKEDVRFFKSIRLLAALAVKKNVMRPPHATHMNATNSLSFPTVEIFVCV